MGSFVSFVVLGPVEVTVDGCAVPLGGPRARAVLAALILEANRVVALGSIVDAAWGSEAPATARFQSQNRVCALRRGLRGAGCDDLIETVGAGYVLTVGPGQLDAQAFEERIAFARRLAASDDLAGAADTISTALALWRGPALHGLGTPRLLAAAERLNEARLAAQELLFDVELRRGRHEEVIGGLMDHSQNHPWRERPIAQLMLALYRAGRRRDALKAFDRTSQLLAAELGLDPGQELVCLRDQILRDDREPVSAAVSRPAPLHIEADRPLTTADPG